MSLFSFFRTTLLLLGLTASGASSMAAFPKEGNYDYTACWSGTVTNTVGISKTSYGVNYEFSGTTMSNPAGGAFDRLAFRCTGIAIHAEGKVSGGNVCETADNDGDKMLTQFTLDASRGEGGGASVALVGTGKYEGLMRSGVADSLGKFPAVKQGTFQGCNRQTGTYKLK